MTNKNERMKPPTRRTGRTLGGGAKKTATPPPPPAAELTAEHLPPNRPPSRAKAVPLPTSRRFSAYLPPFPARDRRRAEPKRRWG
jgi:hypothetical protein